MQEIRLFLVKRNNDYGYWKFFMIGPEEDIYEELAKKYNITVSEQEQELGFNLYSVVDMMYDIGEVDPERLYELLGR